MATVTLSNISAVMNLVFGEAMADQIRRDVLLPNLIEVKPGDGNANATWSAKFTGRTAGGAYNEGADMGDAEFDSHLKVPATLAWAQYRTGAKISGLAEALSRQNGSNAFSGGQFSEEINDAIDFLATKVSTDSWTGNVGGSPIEFAGLETAVDSSGIYATIDPATYPEWASAENPGLIASLSEDYLRENLHRPLKDACGMWPTFCLMDGTTWDRVGATLTDSRRAAVDEVRSLTGDMVNLQIRAGWRAYVVDGVYYIEDRHCPANTIYAFARDAIHYEQVPALGPTQAGVIIETMKAITGVTLEEDEVARMIRMGNRRLTPTIEMLGKTGDSWKAMVKLYAQLVVKYRNRCAKLTLS